MIFFKTRRLLFLAVFVFALFFIFANYSTLSETDIKSKIENIHIPGRPKTPWKSDDALDEPLEPIDGHPISLLMTEADRLWRAYNDGLSTTFSDTVRKYRRLYGRHPPPGFKEWYRFAKKRNVHNIDDFEQIMDDMRPFWAVEPHILRNLAANMWKDKDQGVSGIHIRGHKVVNTTNHNWRTETMVTLIEQVIKYIPDMDIAMNLLDQPRVVIPWDDMQSMLDTEMKTRQTPPKAIDEFSQNMDGLLNLTFEAPEVEQEDPLWFSAPGKPYMDIASTACPPESRARNNGSTQADGEALYKNRLGGIVTNFNRSSDLCTVGPEIHDKHGLLFSASSIIATKRLVPIFGECKVNVNSDILFPANMYWKKDVRYEYDGKFDLDWADKKDSIIWRGVTSGGVQTEENWRNMHRQRLVMLANSTLLKGKEVRILAEQPEKRGEYENFRRFGPSNFAEDHTDIGFTETMGCVPDDCPFYKDVWTFKPPVPLPEQFKSKFVVDVDGHSFSGRWRAFLESKSLGIKATIFREWHDSRLFAWRHFVPMDNRYDDLYSLLTYFLGTGTPIGEQAIASSTTYGDAYVARHDTEGKRIADQGREWAKKVLRREDMEVSFFILHLLDSSTVTNWKAGVHVPSSDRVCSNN